MQVTERERGRLDCSVRVPPTGRQHSTERTKWKEPAVPAVPRDAEQSDRDGRATLSLQRPNRMTHWQLTALHQALRRDNDLEIIEALLDHGADPMPENRRDGKSAVAIAARRGRGDVLESFERRGIPIALNGVERLIAACAK